MDVPIRRERRKMSKTGKKGKRLRGAKHLGHARKRGTEVRHITTFKELDALFKEGYAGLIDFELDENALEAVGKVDVKKESDIDALYDDFIKKTNKCYRENAKSINW